MRKKYYTYFSKLSCDNYRGRVYVCDLAGTEPAGDIEYANYQKIQFDDGSIGIIIC